MMLGQLNSGVNAGWEKKGSEIISSQQTSIAAFSGINSRERLFIPALGDFYIKLEEVGYALQTIGDSSQLNQNVNFEFKYFPSTGNLQAFVYVSDLEWTALPGTFRPPERDQTIGEAPLGDGQPLKAQDVIYPKGIGTHANTAIRIDLDGEYETFTSLVALSDGVPGTAVFRVFVDGTQRYESPTKRGGDTPSSVSVDVRDAQTLTLITGDAGEGISWAHGNWLDAKLTTKPTVAVNVNRVESIPLRSLIESENSPFKSAKFNIQSPFLIGSEPKLSLLQVTCNTLNSSIKLQGCINLKYRLIWT